MVNSHLSSFSRSFSWTGPKETLFLGLIVALFMAVMAPASANDAETRRLKIVFELNNGQSTAFDAFVANVEGLQKHSGSLADITVVASSQGVGLLSTGDDSLQERLTELADRGVDFVVCQAGLDDAGMSASDLLVFARIVRSGNDEVERLEAQGWARVRDGESYVSHL